MNQRARVIVIALAVALAAAVAAAPAAAAAPAPADLDGLLSAGDICELLGGAVALGFGIWHFAVPQLYSWQSYVPDAPQSLVDAVAATNFFFSLSLSLVGATSMVMPFVTSPVEPASQYWLWANVGLWSTRLIYQLVKPQGTYSPALQWGMAAAFAATDALFIAAAIAASL